MSKTLLFEAKPQTAVTIEHMMKCARAHKWAGITVDGAVVTTYECVMSQWRSKTLVMWVHANWNLVQGQDNYKYSIHYCTYGDEYEEFKQRKTLERAYVKEIKFRWLHPKHRNVIERKEGR
jgi:hypothetical protein